MNEAKELRSLLAWWCSKRGEPLPLDKESIQSILDRMESIGIITTEEKRRYSSMDTSSITLWYS